MRLNDIQVLQQVMILCAKGHAFDQSAFQNELGLERAQHEAERKKLANDIEAAKAERDELKAKLAALDDAAPPSEKP